MNQEIKETEQASSLSFARLPIFDAHRHLWGYELSYVPGKNTVIAGSVDTNYHTVEITSPSGSKQCQYPGLTPT